MKAVLQYLKSWTVGRESGSTLELGLIEKSYKEENWDSRIRKDFLNKKDFQHKLCVAWCSKGSCIPGFGEALIQSSASQTTCEGPV